MKTTIYLLLSLFLSSFTHSTVTSYPAKGKVNNDFMHYEGGSGGSPNNLSTFSYISIQEGTSSSRYTKIGSLNTVSYSTIASNANEIMGAFKTDFEFFLLNTEIGQPNFVVVTFRTEVNPYDHIKYRNGLGNLFTEYGDVACDYIQISNYHPVTDSIKSLYKVGPESTELVSNVSMSFSYQYLDTGNGYAAVPIISQSVEVQHKSVEVFNNSSIPQGLVDERFIYPLIDDYSEGLNYEYGFVVVRVIEGLKAFILYLQTKVEFSIAKDGKWGSSVNCGSQLTELNISWQ